MKREIEPIDLSMQELEALVERARQEPLPEEDYRKLKAAVETLEYLTELVADKDTTVRHLRQLLLPAATEKTQDVLANAGVKTAEPTGQPATSQAPEEDRPRPGHGRNGAEEYRGAQKVLVRVVGQAPLAATVYSLERLRCNGCGQVFTAQEPEGIGAEKYDETAAAMIAQLKYGSGTPFYRLEQLEKRLGIPLPAATQWEIVEEEAELIKAARDELIRQAAQGEVMHNDDTSMRVLRL